MQILLQWNHPDKYFYKMHGTGNDFIIINAKQSNGQVLSRQQLKKLAAKLCHRKFGIGADGLLVIQESQGAYKMQVINSDGSQPNMCGNGLRCFVSLLFHQGMIPSQYKVLTDDGFKDVLIQKDKSCQQNSRSASYLVTLGIGKGGLIEQFTHQKYNTLYLTTIGVPHLVVFLDKTTFKQTNFQVQGQQLQTIFNANINFCLIDQNQQIKIKTYQRGAGMTYSCGTGVSSSVYVAIAKHKISKQKIKTITDGGQIQIEVTQQMDVIMKGPAEIICQGYYYHDRQRKDNIKPKNNDLDWI